MPSKDHFRSSLYYSEDVGGELNKELIKKSKDAAPGFFMAAAWVSWSKFATIEFASVILVLGYCLMFFAALRFLVSLLYEKRMIVFRTATRFTIGNIVVNGVLWSITLLLPIIEYKFENIISVVGVVSLLIAGTLSSMVTISYNLKVAYFFQWAVALPSIAYSIFIWKMNGNSAALQVSIIFTIVLLYLFRQTRTVHDANARRISYALDLEHSNKLLVESQDLLIQEKAKLQHSIKLAAIGEISAEIAHEINNPLGIMMGYIELSLDLLKSTSPDKEVLQVQLIKARSAISRITKIIKGLRHYSRRTNDDPLVPVFVNEIIEDAVEFYSEKFNYNNTALEIENPEDYKLLCRPIEISQVLLNIFSNGIDEVSKLDPELRKIKVHVTGTGETVRIAISNHGPKIKAEVQDKLFEPFFSTKKIGIGTGLGLSISRGIIESYKGRLYYDPLPVQTTFVIELPQHSSN